MTQTIVSKVKMRQKFTNQLDSHRRYVLLTSAAFNSFTYVVDQIKSLGVVDGTPPKKLRKQAVGQRAPLTGKD